MDGRQNTNYLPAAAAGLSQSAQTSTKHVYIWRRLINPIRLPQYHVIFTFSIQVRTRVSVGTGEPCKGANIFFPANFFKSDMFFAIGRVLTCILIKFLTMSVLACFLSILIKFFLCRRWARAGVTLPGHTKCFTNQRRLNTTCFHNKYAVGRGLWLQALGRGPWAVSRGPWAVGCGLWAVGCGLWAVGRVGQILRIAIITW